MTMPEVVINSTNGLFKDIYYPVPKADVNNLALFFCPLLFSAIDHSLFYKILCAIMLEYSVIFISPNVALLTSAMYFFYLPHIRLGYCAVLDPLRWEHVLIPILPDICSEFIEAPVPLLAGIPKDYQDCAELLDITWSRETLLVILEEKKVIRCGPAENGAMSLPKLGGLKELIALEYKPFEGVSLCYVPNEAQIKATRDICGLIKSLISKIFLNEINKANCESFISKTTGVVEVDQVKSSITQIAATVDLKFLEKLCETQMVAAYIKERYDSSANFETTKA
eukprot:TRINITY_DN1137_c0_g2_i1.p1 TRINITY_DN1137_c0_g2~~TRINITY_DN1137_c0_g2_i1.p1  ORF type:complete len:282 (+),score=59.22 TRINITY_DN1137_c0_g2_i1:1621-2466(+)